MNVKYSEVQCSAVQCEIVLCCVVCVDSLKLYVRLILRIRIRLRIRLRIYPLDAVTCVCLSVHLSSRSIDQVQCSTVQCSASGVGMYKKRLQVKSLLISPSNSVLTLSSRVYPPIPTPHHPHPPLVHSPAHPPPLPPPFVNPPSAVKCAS